MLYNREKLGEELTKKRWFKQEETAPTKVFLRLCGRCLIFTLNLMSWLSKDPQSRSHIDLHFVFLPNSKLLRSLNTFYSVVEINFLYCIIIFFFFWRLRTAENIEINANHVNTHALSLQSGTN